MQDESGRIYDQFLVMAVNTGDRAALARLVARWQPRLLGHARRVLGDGERAQDIVQDAWMQILRGLGSLDDVAAFPAWAFRVVSRCCYRQFRRPHLDATGPDDASSCDFGMSGYTSAEIGSDMARVMAAIAALPPGQKAALALFHLEGMSVAQVAVALDVPPGTVKTRLMHARYKVRKHLEGDRSGQA